jgi:hypothetical protein
VAGSEFGGADELRSEVAEIASFVSDITFADAFRDREQRLQKCIDIEADYVD